MLRPGLPHLLLAVCFSLPKLAWAAPVTILNPSFETPTTMPATFTGQMASGPNNWSVYNTVAPNDFRYFGVWNPSTTNSYVNGAPHGSNVGVAFLLNSNYVAEAGLQQTLSATLQASTTYTLQVEIGNFSPADGGPFDFTGFPGYRVDFMAGNTVLALDNNTLAPGEGIFLTSTVTFTTGVSHLNLNDPLRIRLVNLNNGPGVEVNFDLVRLDATPVPEPGTGILGGLGLLVALAGTRFRRKGRV